MWNDDVQLTTNVLSVEFIGEIFEISTPNLYSRNLFWDTPSKFKEKILLTNAEIFVMIPQIVAKSVCSAPFKSWDEFS